MSEDDFILDQLTDEVNGKVAWKWINKGLILNAHKRQLDYEFRGRIYPSALYWGMCPMKYAKNIRKGTFFKISKEGEEKKAAGSALHTVVQEALHPGAYYWGDPNYPEWIVERMKEKEANGDTIRPLPEVYCCCDEWLTSGWLDFTGREKKKLVIVDFKFTNVLPEEWEDKQKELPGIKYETQLYIYAEHVNKYSYYSRKVDGLRLVVKNRWVIPELLPHHLRNLDSEFEWYSDYDEEKGYMTRELLTDTANHVRLLLADKFVEECNHKFCNEHRNILEI